MASLLFNILEVTVGPGGSVTVPHGIFGSPPDGGGPSEIDLPPNMILPDRATPIFVAFVDDEVVVFTNPGLVEESASFYAQLQYSTQRLATDSTVIFWNGAESAAPIFGAFPLFSDDGVAAPQRPAANTLPAGTPIFNVDDAALNISDGTVWRNALGAQT